MTLFSKARRRFRERLTWIERQYASPRPNYGIWVTRPAPPPVSSIPALAPHLVTEERKDTALWPALFDLWPDWTWGMQPTGDCTSWMQKHLLDVLMAVAVKAGKQRKPDALVDGASIYGFAKCELANSYRYHGAGSTGYDVAKACCDFGHLYRQRYAADGKTIDLGESENGYSPTWGDRGKGVPDWLEPFAAKHLAEGMAKITSAREMGLLIQAGYPCGHCGYTYWGTRRDSAGVATRFSSGWHAMAITGVRWDDDGEPLAFWNANTGHGDHCSGPAGPMDVPDVYADCGSWLPTARVAKVIRAGDCYTLTLVKGWPNMLDFTRM